MVVSLDSQVIFGCQDTLGAADYHIRVALSGSDALHQMQTYGLPQLALIDCELAGEVSADRLGAIIQQISDVPLIMLLPAHAADGAAEALERYAEDCLVKPLRHGVLLLRVRSILRRLGHFGFASGPVTAVDDYLQVDFFKRQLILDGQRIALEPTETKLLYVLMRHAGRTLSVDFLSRRVWQTEKPAWNRTRKYISALRNKLRQSPRAPRYIVSRSKTGYRFNVTPPQSHN